MIYVYNVSYFDFKEGNGSLSARYCLSIKWCSVSPFIFFGIGFVSEENLEKGEEIELLRAMVTRQLARAVSASNIL